MTLRSNEQLVFDDQNSAECLRASECECACRTLAPDVKIDGVASNPTLLDIRPLALKPLLTCGWLKHVAPLLAITLPAIASSRVWDLHQLRLSKPVHRDDLRAQSDAQDQGHEEPAPDQAAISLGRLSGGGCSSWKVTEAV